MSSTEDIEYQQFLQDHGHLVQIMIDAGWSRWESRHRLARIYPDIPQGLAIRAIEDQAHSFRLPVGDPITATVASCALWIAVNQSLGLGEDREFALVHGDPKILDELSQFFEYVSLSRESVVTIMGWMGATFRHLSANPRTTLTSEQYTEFTRNQPPELQEIAQNRPEMKAPSEKVIRTRLGHGSWDRALMSSGLAPTQRFAPDGHDQNPVFTEDRFRSAIADFLTYCIRNNRQPQSLAYGSWAAEPNRHHVPRPLLVTVLQHYGSWRKALAHGRELINQDAPSQADPRHQEKWVGPWTRPIRLSAVESGATWTTKDWQEEGIGVVETRPRVSPESPWEELVHVLDVDLSGLPWHHFMTVEYLVDTDQDVHPQAQALTGPEGITVTLLSEQELPTTAWGIDTQYLTDAGWNPPTAALPQWHLLGLSPEEAAHELVHGLRFGRLAPNPYLYRWGTGALYGAEEADLEQPRR